MQFVHMCEKWILFTPQIEDNSIFPAIWLGKWIFFSHMHGGNVFHIYVKHKTSHM